MFRSTRTIFRELMLSLAKVTLLPGTHYTHHSLKHMLPQYCKTYNDVFLLITSTKV